MSRILFMKWRKNMLASEKIWRELCFHRVKMASSAAKKKTLLLLMMMQDEELPVSYERRINYHSCTGDAPIFNINANSCSLLCLGIAIFKHERAELWELKMLISYWFIFNWSQGSVSPTTLFTRGTKQNIAGDQSLRLVPRIQTGLNSWDRFRGPKYILHGNTTWPPTMKTYSHPTTK